MKGNRYPVATKPMIANPKTATSKSMNSSLFSRACLTNLVTTLTKYFVPQKGKVTSFLPILNRIRTGLIALSVAKNQTFPMSNPVHLNKYKIERVPNLSKALFVLITA
mmetsp:Transcript_15102/g.17105  ORF Transcript_15102/g.17105 Transcript_15102/m.17105 type:complete len:108 (-) Transcript_15102:1155-1478(-)